MFNRLDLYTNLLARGSASDGNTTTGVKTHVANGQ